MSPTPTLTTTVTLVLFYEDGKQSSSSYDKQSLKKQKKMCIITLDRDELSFLANRKKDDTTNICPFDFTFTKERIWKVWCYIGFILMNRKCLENFKVRQELGVGRANDDTNQELGNWQEEYNEAKERCAKFGLNMDILDIELSVCNNPPDIIANREALIKKLIKNKATKSSGCAFKLIETTMANGPDLVETTWIKVEDEAKEEAEKVSAVKMKLDLIKYDAISL